MSSRFVAGETKALVYKMAIRPTLTYAAAAWLNVSNISSHQIEQLRVIERKQLRKFVRNGYDHVNHRYMNSSTLYRWAGVRRIDVLMGEQICSFYQRCVESSDDEIVRIVSDKYKPACDLYFRATNGTFFENGKFLIFNKWKYGAGECYVTNQ